MTNDTQGKAGKEDFENPSVQANHGRPRVSRRQILKVGATIPPVVLTLTSRPAMGAWCTPSTWASANLSGKVQDCNGRTPGYWKTHPELWEACGLDPGTCTNTGGGGKGGGGTCTAWSGGTPFHGPPLFGPAGVVNVGTLSAMQVLWQMPGSFASFAVAAYLNACSDIGYALSEGDVLAIVNAIISSGIYGELMSVADAKEFLEQTMNL